MAKRKQEHWSFAALRQRLSEKTEVVETSETSVDSEEARVQRTYYPVDWEYGTVFLFDPQLRERFDNFFFNFLYPCALEVFENAPFQIPDLEEIKLTDKRDDFEATRHVVFLMTDPKRPTGNAESPWWLIRYNVEVRHFIYYVNVELSLSLPYSIEPDWALNYLIDAGHQGVSPSLSVDYDEFVLRFSRGHSESISVANTEWKHNFTSFFNGNLQVAKMIDRFSENPSNQFLRSRMLQTITEFYKSF